MRQGMNTERIPIAGPWITAKEVSYVADAAANAWYADANVFHQRFEEAFANYVGRAHAIALPSCTSAIHLALAAIGIGPGDEVIVPELTWIASAAPIDYVGATTVFADVDADTWCLSAESLESSISPRTRAIIPVDLYGNMPQMDRICQIAADHDIAVIEDAAEAIGSAYHGRRAGSWGQASVFSFHGSKTLTTGEGGMLVTDCDDLRNRVLFLRDHGRDPRGKVFWNTQVAFKYRMSGLQAAMGLAQTERLDELVDRKRRIFSWYQHDLADCDGLTLNAEPPDTLNSYWMVTALLDPSIGIEKEQIIEQLAARNIDSRPLFYPLSSLPAHEGLDAAHQARQRNEIAYRLSPYGVNLPSAMTLTEADVHRVCQAIKEIVGHS